MFQFMIINSVVGISTNYQCENGVKRNTKCHALDYNQYIQTILFVHFLKFHFNNKM